MRPRLAVSVALLLLFGCASRVGNDPGRAPQPPPAVLNACSDIVVSVDGASVALTTNVDDSLTRVVVLWAADARVREVARQDIFQRYGPAREDSRFVDRPWHFGFTRRYDLCGHPLD